MLAQRSIARAARRWTRIILTTLSNDVSYYNPIVNTDKNVSQAVSTAALLFASSSAVAITTAWAAAADPSSPFSAPPVQPQVQSNEGTAQWRIFTDLARDLAREGKKEEAERYLKRALVAARQGFGESDPHVASACQNLAELYRLQKKYDLAGPLYDEALTILGQAYGPKDIRVAFALHNVAGYYYAQRNWDQASHYYEQALQVKLAAVGPGHMETANTLFHLSEVRWNQGRRKEAIELAKQSLDCLENQRASDAACARRRMRLADMLIDTKDYYPAEQLLRKVLEEASLEGMGRIPAAENLARVLVEQGKYKEAEKLLKDSIQRRKDHRGDSGGREHHPAAAAALRRLAEVELARIKTESKLLRPVEMTELQIEAFQSSKEAVEIASRALETCMQSREKQEEIERTKGDTSFSWLDSIIPGRKEAKKLKESLALKRLQAIRPEVAALEMALALTTRAQVKSVLDEGPPTSSTSVADRDGNIAEENDCADLLCKAVELLTKAWPGKTLGDQSKTKVEDAHHQALCRTLSVWLSIEKKDKARIDELKRLMKANAC